MVKVKMTWGSDRSFDRTSDIKEFATQAELDAYLQGVDDMDGWLDYDAEPVAPEPIKYAKVYQIDYLISIANKGSIATCRSCGTNLSEYSTRLKEIERCNQIEVKCNRCGCITRIIYWKDV